MGGIFSKRSRTRRARAQRGEPTPTTKSDGAVPHTSVDTLATNAPRDVQVRHTADFNQCQLNTRVNKVSEMDSVASLRHPRCTPPNTAPSNGFVNCYALPLPIANCYNATHASPTLLSPSQYQPSPCREFPSSTTGYWRNDNHAHDTQPSEIARTLECTRNLDQEYEQFYEYPTYDEYSASTFSSQAPSVCESDCSSTAAVIGNDDLDDFSSSLDEQFLEPIFSDSTTSTSAVLGDSNIDIERFSGSSHTKQVRFPSNTSNASSTRTVLGEYDVEDFSHVSHQKLMESSFSSSASSSSATILGEYDLDASSHFSDGLPASFGVSSLAYIDGDEDFRGGPAQPVFDNSFTTQNQSEYSRVCNIDGCLQCADGHRKYKNDSNCSSVYIDQLSVSSQESDHDFAAEEMYFDDGGEFPSLTNISTLPVVDMHNLHKDKLIARGGSGSIYRVRHTETSEIFALKEMDMDTTPDRSREEMERSVRREEVASKKLAGIPWVVNTHQITREGTTTSILMEFCSRGDLMSLMERSRAALTYETIQKIAANIVLALEAIHNRGVVHRDLKPENILQDDNGTLKLTDFDLVHTNMFLEPKATGEDVGTLDFMSPEVYLGEAHNSTADCWALGAILHELLTGRPPFYFPGEDEERKMRRVVHEPLPDYGLVRTHPVAYDLISALMHKNPKFRLGSRGTAEIKRHPYFNGFNFQALENGTTSGIPEYL